MPPLPSIHTCTQACMHACMQTNESKVTQVYINNIEGNAGNEYKDRIPARTFAVSS